MHYSLEKVQICMDIVKFDLSALCVSRLHTVKLLFVCYQQYLIFILLNGQVQPYAPLLYLK